MELNLFAESDSDSDNSNNSNRDNASAAQRSAITVGTGSDQVAFTSLIMIEMCRRMMKTKILIYKVTY